MFKKCNKCDAKYLLFHLKSDCEFAKEKFEVLKILVKNNTYNSENETYKKHIIPLPTLLLNTVICKRILHLLRIETKNKDLTLQMLEKIGLNSDANDNVELVDNTRWNSAPFLIIVIGFLFSGLFTFLGVGIALNTLLPFFGILVIIYGIFSIQGGYNLTFKEIMLLDILKRNRCKVKEWVKRP